jgi:nitrogen-specific signal transduction histidine kinase/CheY-like chemotaxis protein
VAAQMSWAIENARLFEETEERARELELTARQLRETDQFRAQFLANMSHELRTPLNSIIGFSRVILKGIDGPLTELQKTDLEAIYSNGQHLLTMINEILDMSKIEAGKMELVIENVDLNVLIRGVISASTALIKDKPVELKTNIQDDLPAVRADGTRIRQVITNLMSNAAKFTEEGAITFSVWTEEEMVYVSVKDTGEGIPEGKIPLVFEAFRQVDGSSTRRAEGTGLGLPISRQFVEMHGGRIWLDSEYGVGSEFTFCIPIEGPVEDVPELRELEIDEAKRLLLVVVCDESSLEAYRTVLEPDGYQVVGLYDLRVVVRWTRYLSPWAILMEVDREGDAGWTALEALKSMRATRDYPVIACTGLEEGGRAISMGAVAHVPKPIQRQELIGVLDRLESSKS